MISVSSEMIFKLIVLSVAFGGISAIFYRGVSCATLLLAKALSRRKSPAESTGMKPSLFRQAFDFLFAFAVGISYLLISYVCVDGELEIYSIIALFVSFLLTNKVVLSIVAPKQKNNE